jgi:methionine biosynthesis protein MetW
VSVATSAERAARVGTYENARPEVQALVPRDARRVLDVGCASGALGAALKARQGCTVVGVEVDPRYAARARERLDQVVECDLESFVPERTFDCLIAADVLEHLREPLTALRRAAQALTPGGAAVVSLPNVRYWNTFWQLGVRGRWPQQPDGIFDRTHLRWFTGRDGVDLMAEAGLELEAVHRVHRLRPSRVSPWDARVGRVAERTPLRPFLTFQVVLRARKPPARG